MTVSSPRSGAQPAAVRPPGGRRERREKAAPIIALALGALLLAVVAAIVGARATGYALDETLFKASAQHYTHDLPSSLFHDLNARATSRLYALTLAPLYAVFDGDTALRLAKVWNAVLFASAAAPAYLLARMAIRSRWLAVAAALLSVALPWVTLTSGLYTEALAYPVALWATWAIARSVLAPSWRRDLAVLALIVLAVVSRVQLIALLGGYVGLVAVLAAFAAPAGALARDRLRAAVAYLRDYPFTVAVVAVAALVLLAMAARGTLGAEIDKLTGSYGEFQYRTTVPTDVPIGALVELISLALGVGLVPAIIALAWYPAAVRDRTDLRARALAGTAIAVTASVWAFALAAQSGFIGQITEERYYIYVVPFAWFATFAALERPRVRASAIAWSGALMAVLLGAIALPYSFTRELFLAPAGKTVVRLNELALERVRDVLDKGGLTGRDLLFVVGTVVAIALTLAWRRAPWLRRWLIGGAAVAQLALTAYALLAIDGRVADGAVSRTGPPSLAARAWLDNRGVDDVSILRNAVWADPNLVIGTLRDDEFYNNAIARRVGVGATGPPTETAPVDALPLAESGVRDADGRLEPDLPAGPVLSWTDSPILQLAGRQVADDPFGQPWELDQVARPARATWLTLGLRSDGSVVASSPVRLAAWPQGGAAVARIVVAPPVSGGGAIRIRLGGREKTVKVPPHAAPVTVRIPVCGAHVTGGVDALKTWPQADGANVAAMLRSVRLEPAGPACPS